MFISMVSGVPSAHGSMKWKTMKELVYYRYIILIIDTGWYNVGRIYYNTECCIICIVWKWRAWNYELCWKRWYSRVVVALIDWWFVVPSLICLFEILRFWSEQWRSTHIPTLTSRTYYSLLVTNGNHRKKPGDPQNSHDLWTDFG